MKLILPTLVVLVSLLAAPAYAQDNGTAPNLDKSEVRVLNEVLSETLACAAYYSIAVEGMSRRDENDPVSRMEQIIDNLLTGAFVIAETINMKREAVKIRFKWSVRDQMELIDHNMVNISILIDKYADFCKQIYESDPKIRMRYWADRLFPDRS